MLTKLPTLRHDKKYKVRFLDQGGAKEFEGFPGAHSVTYCVLWLSPPKAAKADTAKPMKGLGSGIYEVALAWRGEAYRTVYIVPLGTDVWVVHAFQKKSTKGIKTAKHEINLIRERIKWLKEMLI